VLVKSKPVIFKVLSQFVCLYLVVQGTPVPWMEHIWSVTWLCTLPCLQKYAHIFVSKEETYITTLQQHNIKSKICTFQIWYFSRQNSNEITLIWKILSISFSFLYRQDFGLSELTVKKKSASAHFSLPQFAWTHLWQNMHWIISWNDSLQQISQKQDPLPLFCSFLAFGKFFTETKLSQVLYFPSSLFFCSWDIYQLLISTGTL
jgi:hypothetical protein